MEQNEKRRFDALETLRASAWHSFDTRRTYEWKVAIILWTALASFIVLVISDHVELSPKFLTGTVVLLVVVIVSHYRFAMGVFRANKIDRDVSFQVRTLMNEKLEIQYTKETRDAIDRTKRFTHQWLYWSPAMQIGVTLALAIAVVLVVMFPDSHRSKDTSENFIRPAETPWVEPADL